MPWFSLYYLIDNRLQFSYQNLPLTSLYESFFPSLCCNLPFLFHIRVLSWHYSLALHLCILQGFLFAIFCIDFGSSYPRLLHSRLPLSLLYFLLSMDHILQASSRRLPLYSQNPLCPQIHKFQFQENRL